MGFLSAIGGAIGNVVAPGIGGAIGGALGGALEGKSASGAVGGAGARGAAMADPFGKYRGPFAQMLLDLYGLGGTQGQPPSPAAGAGGTGSSGGGGTAGTEVPSGIANPQGTTGFGSRYNTGITGNLNTYNDGGAAQGTPSTAAGSNIAARIGGPYASMDDLIAAYPELGRLPQERLEGLPLGGMEKLFNKLGILDPSIANQGGAGAGAGAGGGISAADAQQAQLDRIKNLPGYQFEQQEMARQTGRAASAYGGVGSGKMYAELMDRSGQLATRTFSQEVQRLMTLSGATIGSPGTAGQLAYQSAVDSAGIGIAADQGLSQALGYAFNQGGGGGGSSGGGTTTWGDTYVNTDYGPVIPRDGFNY